MVKLNRDKDKIQGIRSMFDRIARRYDMLNHLLSGYTDFIWRKYAVKKLNVFSGDWVLDVAIGTGDLSAAVLKGNKNPKSIVGVDISEKMMQIGRKKMVNYSNPSVQFVGAEAEFLPFRPATFDRVMVAFGVRNFADVTAGLNGILHVLKPGGRLVVLELSYPRHKLFKYFYRFYSTFLVPLIGGWISGDRSAYRYLQVSVVDFPSRERLRAIMNSVGFNATWWCDLSLGVATVYWGEKML